MLARRAALSNIYRYLKRREYEDSSKCRKKRERTFAGMAKGNIGYDPQPAQPVDCIGAINTIADIHDTKLPTSRELTHRRGPEW